MNNQELRKLQLTQLDMLKEVKRICNKNSIHYILTDGTLLGAVRHKGFIPWDDDLDVAMLRPEYEKFIQVASRELSKDYFLQTWKTDQDYPFPYAKILKNNTKCTEAVTKGTRVRDGIFIDIFPIDKCGSSEEMNSQIQKYIIWTKILLMKCHYKVWNATGAKNSKINYLPFILLSKLFTKKSLIRKVELITNEWNRKYSNSLFCYENTGYNFKQWIMNVHNVDSYTEIQFEDDTFSAPERYHEYLDDIYGDYMQLPPVGERENRHAVLELKF